jgi:hypothetical protein
MGFTEGAYFDHLVYGLTIEEFLARREQRENLLSHA